MLYAINNMSYFCTYCSLVNVNYIILLSMQLVMRSTYIVFSVHFPK